MRIAIDIDSTLHHYWDRSRPPPRAASASSCPTSEQLTWGITAPASPSSSSACIAETHCDERDPRRRALPGRGRDGPRAGTTRATSSTSPATARPSAPRRHRALAERDRAALRRAVLLLRQGRALRGDRHRRADRRQPGQPRARALEAGHRRRDAPAPVEPRRVRGRGRHRRRATGPSWRELRCVGRLGRPRVAAMIARPMSARTAHRPRPAAERRRRGPTCATSCPASSPSARSPTGAAPSASRACVDRTVVEFSTATGSAARSRASRTCPPTAARCWSPTTPARCRPTRR